MSTSPASFLGIESLPAAIVFTVAYVPLSGLFIWRAATRFNFVFVYLIIFCLIRTAAFAMRAALAGSTSAAQNTSLLIADLVLFGAGFAGLLFSLFSLESDREQVVGSNFNHPVLNLLRHRRVLHLFIGGAVALTITGSVKLSSDSASSRNTGSTLRTAGVWLIFAITVVGVLRAAALIHYDRLRSMTVKHSSVFDRHASTILGVISLLFLVRMIYSVITISKRQHEDSWYPLSAFTEFLCVCLFATPGLVLSRAELQEKDVELKGYYNQPHVAPPTIV
ncbi:hypothetical protein P691DRAFT_805100 [Macrolepiota fuliginosa MF-IS2]|uniref:DUF7702 domain-containing protein n=1 Tax=Macrolepiota fuliginosa MF-IS2 TaxID=1400762 RepID=A0A9P6C1S3_9AGAR|nr:hypothetical protein P691DRAFT_805100 [Macrolepiota fuliginosa MF-IS2]